MSRVDPSMATYRRVCEDCGVEKDCLKGVVANGDQPAETFYRCIDCDNALVDRYEQSLAAVEEPK